MANPNTPYSDRFGCSSPDTRNMDTMMRQAQGLRKRASEQEYVEFVAQNMERIAEEYAQVFQKMISARSIVMDIENIIKGRLEDE